MAEQGSARAALDALPAVARAAGSDDYAPCSRGTAEAEWHAGQRAGAIPLAFGSADYPSDLAQIADPPPMLWALGDRALLARPMIAVVGSRNASSLGLRMARSLALGLGEASLVTVSGFARGIDTAVHEASLASGTVAILAGGVDVVYPAENAGLAREMDSHGLRLSEQPPGLEPQARHFPRRNRIISGLARAVVVVEAAAKSGSLITARMALEQGREVLAVPGHPFDARAAGCNMLIRDGATLVRGARDVLDALAPGLADEPPTRAAGRIADAEPPAPKRETTPAPEAPAVRARAAPPLPAPPGEPPPLASLGGAGTLHRKILDHLGAAPTPEDQLIRDLGLTAGEIAPALVILELDGRILRQPGGLLSRIDG